MATRRHCKLDRQPPGPYDRWRGSCRQSNVWGWELLFESGDWAAKTGIPAENSEIWQPGWSLNIEAFDAYRREVQQSMDSLLAGLDPATLDDDIEAFGSPRRRGWMLRVAVSNHILSHLGEVSTLRGMKGLAGLPI